MPVGVIFKSGDTQRKMAKETLAEEMYVVNGDEAWSGILAADVATGANDVVVPAGADTAICATEGPVYFTVGLNPTHTFVPVLPTGGFSKTTIRRLPNVLGGLSPGDRIRLIAPADTRVVIDFRRLG